MSQLQNYLIDMIEAEEGGKVELAHDVRAERLLRHALALYRALGGDLASVSAAEAERKSVVQPYSMGDDPGRKAMASEVGLWGFGHRARISSDPQPRG